MKSRLTRPSVVVLSALLGACSAPGPVVPVAPSVRVAQFNSVLITPEAIHFQAKIVIDNRMRAGLNIASVDWGADLHDTPLFDERFTELHPMRARAHQTVTFPFQIVMKDIEKQLVDVLAEEAIRVAFRGVVHPVGFGPIPFHATRTIPFPRTPVVSIVGTEGAPGHGMFKVFLKIGNTNSFPLTLQSIDSHLAINGKRYRLFETQKPAKLGPGTSAVVPLAMERSTGKALSMIWNVIHSDAPRFELGGSFRCATPYGVVHVPIKIGSNAFALRR